MKPGQAYLSRNGIRQIKSVLTNDIFKQELLHIYEQKSQSRNGLIQEAREALLELTRQMHEGICNHPEMEKLMAELAVKLETVSGKRSYGYLPKPVKKNVGEIVDEMERLPIVAQSYEKWLELQNQADSYYGGDARKRLKLSQQKEFRAIKNAVIHEAERIRLGELSFEDGDLEQRDELEEEPEAGYSSWRVVDDIYDETLPLEERGAAVDELKAIAEKGEPFAQYYLGKLYRDGGLLIPDSELAADWFYKPRNRIMLSPSMLWASFFSPTICSSGIRSLAWSGWNTPPKTAVTTPPIALERNISRAKSSRKMCPRRSTIFRMPPMRATSMPNICWVSCSLWGGRFAMTRNWRSIG